MKNPTLSLTDLVDVILKSGVPKSTKVSQVKSRPDYEPAFDYYKQLRESIIENHQRGGSKKEFEVVASASCSPNKFSNYNTAIKGYSKWWGNKSFTWVDPARNIYSNNGIDVIVNPELGLEWNGQLHYVKLYLKSDPLTKPRADLILTLLRESLTNKAPKGTKMTILDVRAARLFTDTSKKVPIAVVDAELAYIAALWPTI